MLETALIEPKWVYSMLRCHEAHLFGDNVGRETEQNDGTKINYRPQL